MPQKSTKYAYFPTYRIAINSRRVGVVEMYVNNSYNKQIPFPTDKLMQAQNKQSLVDPILSTSRRLTESVASASTKVSRQLLLRWNPIITAFSQIDEDK